MGLVSSGNSRWRWLMALILAAVACRGVTRINEQSEPYLNNDEPRHLMTAIFWYDFARVLPDRNWADFAYTYYGHFPAIAPVHWPPLTHFAGAALFSVTGPSIDAARCLILAMALILIVAVYRLGVSEFSPAIGTAAAAMLAASTAVSRYESVFMLEIPCMMWITLTLLAFASYIRTARPWSIWLCGAFATAAMLTKQHSAVLAPILLTGATLGFQRHHWRSVHPWVAGIAAVTATAAYYLWALGLIESSWYDLTVPYNTTWAPAWRAAVQIGPVTMGAALLAGVWLAARRPRQWVLWSLAVWAAAQTAMYGLVALKIERYLVYMAPAVSLLAAWGISQVLHRRQASVRVAALAACVALAWGPLWTPSDRSLTGYRQAVVQAAALDPSRPVVFSGRYDGIFILFRRLSDPQLSSITFRSGKLFGDGVIMSDRNYKAQVDSVDAMRRRFLECGARFVVLDDSPENGSREHAWFREWVCGDAFESVGSVALSYPWSEASHLRFYRYRGEIADFSAMHIPMRTLTRGGFGFDASRSLLMWNDYSRRE